MYDIVDNHDIVYLVSIMVKLSAIITLQCLLVVQVAAQSTYSRRVSVPLVKISPRCGYSMEATPWANIPFDSIGWFFRATYEIDPGASKNQIFKNADTPLINVLCNDIIAGRIMAYGAETDSFTSKLSYNEISAIYSQVLPRPTEIYRFRIIESVLCSKYSNRQYRNILGIAPEKQDKSGTWIPLFWIYYPSSRSVLARHIINKNRTPTWQGIFENRDFSAHLLFTIDSLQCSN